MGKAAATPSGEDAPASLVQPLPPAPGAGSAGSSGRSTEPLRKIKLYKRVIHHIKGKTAGPPNTQHFQIIWLPFTVVSALGAMCVTVSVLRKHYTALSRRPGLPTAPL